MSEEKSPTNIGTAIHQVMQQVSYVTKDSQMRGGGNYKYTSEAHIISMLRPAMLEAGIIMYPSGVQEMHISTYPTKNSQMNHIVCVYKWVFLHAASDTFIEVTTTGEGADVGDKGANKSMTAAKKYALLQTFLIQTGDDPDHVGSHDMARATPQTSQPQSPKEEANADVVPHWNWPVFWQWAKNDLGLSDDEVHEALGVSSIKEEWRKTKSEAVTILEGYARSKETQRVLREEASIEDTY